MAPRTSQVWIHFSTPSEGKVKCLYCGEQLSIKNKSTYSLIRHIKHKHATQTMSSQTVTEAPMEEDSCLSSDPLLEAAEDSICSLISSQTVTDLPIKEGNCLISDLQFSKKSPFWTYFSKPSEGKVTCLYCGQELSVKNKSTCSLIRHIRNKHPYTQTICCQTVTDSPMEDDNCSSSDQLLEAEKDSTCSLIPHINPTEPFSNQTVVDIPIKEENCLSFDQHASKKSPFWTHFLKVSEGKAKCIYCGQEISVKNKSTGSLIRHIKIKHPTEANICQTVDEDNCSSSDQLLEAEENSTCSLIPHLDPTEPISSPTVADISIKEEHCSSSDHQAPKKSPIWAHFSKGSEGKVKCIYCGQELSVKNKSTCSLIRHIRTKHPTQENSCQTVSEAPIDEDNCSSSDQLLQAAEDSPCSVIPHISDPTEPISSQTITPISIKKENCSSTDPQAPKKSPVWTHFSKVSEGKVKCHYCEQELSVKNKSTCSLIRHIKTKHPTQSISRQTVAKIPIREYNCVSSQQFQRRWTFKMASRRSQIWRHFSKTFEGRVTCLYCGQELSVKNKSTCSLIRHMKQKHPTQPIYKQRVTEAVREDNCSSSDPYLQAAADSASGAGSTQEPLPMATQKQIDVQLICMIAKEYHPISIVEDKEFKRLLYLLNPDYKVPTRKTVSSFMIPALYNETFELVRSRLDRALTVCLTADGWTCRTKDSFYSITAHYIVDERNSTFLASDLLGCISYTDKHTAEHIANKLQEVIDEWKLTDKIAAVVSDTEANIKEAVSIGGWNYWGCFAHSLNLVALSGLGEIKEVVDKIKNIVGWFKRSSQALSQLEASAESMDMPALKLKNDVPRRWNSTYDMISRFLQMKNAIIVSLGVLSTNSTQHDDFRLITQLCDEEWTIAEQAMKVLELFNLITLAISSEQKLNTSTIIFYYKQISKHLESIDLTAVMPQVQIMVETLTFELENRFLDIQENHLIAQATILDPRFKKLGFVDADGYNRAVEHLYAEVANTTLVDESVENQSCDTIIKSEPIDQDILPEKNQLDVYMDCLWNDFDVEARQLFNSSNSRASTLAEVDKYLEESILPRKDASGTCQDPLVWWHQRKHIYPKLYQIMKSRLCIMATAVPCKRIFSKAEQMISEKRDMLKTDKISQLVFLNYNLNSN